MNFTEYKSLYSDLLHQQRSYDRFRKWFKPVLIIAAVAVLAGTVLPILLPITAPIVIVGAVTLLFRWVLYRFVFKDPVKRFRGAYETQFLHPLLHELHPKLKADKWRTFETRDLNESQLFIDRIDESRQHGAAKTDSGSSASDAEELRLAWFRLVREKITIGGLLHDFAEDVFMELTGDDGDFDEERNHKTVSVFSGMIFRMPFHGQGNWLVLPTGLLELYKQRARFPALPAHKLSETLTLFLPERVTGPSTELRALLTKQPTLFVRSDDTHLWIALPRRKSMLQIDLDEADTITKDDLTQFTADLRWLKEVFENGNLSGTELQTTDTTST